MIATRAGCSASRQRNLLFDQHYLCIYCAVPFGAVVKYRGRHRITVVHFDHVLPYAFLGANPDPNWAAACDICNQIKGAGVYTSIDEIREDLAVQRERRGFEVVWHPPVSSEEDPERWAIKFSGFLASMPSHLVGQIERPSLTRRPRAAVSARAGAANDPQSHNSTKAG